MLTSGYASSCAKNIVAPRFAAGIFRYTENLLDRSSAVE
jgi:hypothetical protein